MASHHKVLFLAAAGLLATASMTGSGCGRSPDVQGGSGGSVASGGAGGLDDTVITDFEACATETATATLTPVNMFITVDKSGSMANDNKWVDTVSAFTAFFQDPSASSLKVALRLWPYPFPLTGAAEEGCDGVNCSTNACATPTVALDQLSNVAHQQALVAAFEGTTPDGSTPMSAALEGAVQWATTLQGQLTQEERIVIILVTDGEPHDCVEDVPTIASIAADAYNSNGIPTFVVGLQGAFEATVNSIAAAGGTDQGFFIGVNAETELLAALLDIAGQAVDCSFIVPSPASGETLDPRLVRVEFTGTDGNPVLIDKVAGPADCAAGGWYYDDDNNPTTITLCPSTCGTVQGDVAAQMEIALGCECERDSDCGAGFICENNHCVDGCKDDSECADGFICVQGRCVPEEGEPCKVDSDCPKGMYCIGGQCSLGGVIVGREEAVQGGAFSCAVTAPLRSTSGGWLAAMAALGALGLRRRRTA